MPALEKTHYCEVRARSQTHGVYPVVTGDYGRVGSEGERRGVGVRPGSREEESQLKTEQCEWCSRQARQAEEGGGL